MRTRERSKRSQSATSRVARRIKKDGDDLTLRSLDHALGTTDCSVADAARWMGVSRSTVTKWLAGTAKVNVDAVLRSQRLAIPFARFLCHATIARHGRRR